MNPFSLQRYRGHGDEATLARQQLKKAVGVAAVLGGLLFIALLYSRSESYQHKQALRQSELALEAYEKGNLEQAQELGQKAWALGSMLPEVISNLAKMASRSNSPDALTLWKHYSKLTGQSLHQGKLATPYALALLNTGNIAEAKSLSKNILSNPPSQYSEQLLSLLAQLEYHQGKAISTLGQLDQLSQIRELNPKEQLIKEDTLLNQIHLPGHSEAQQKFLSRLKTIDFKKDPQQLKLLEKVLNYPPVETSERNDLLSIVANNQLIPEELKLRALNLAIEDDPGNEQQIIAEAAEKRKGKDASSLSKFCHWLNQRGKYEQTLTILKPYPNAKLGTAIREKCDALLYTMKEEQLHELIVKENNGLLPSQQQLYQAHLYLSKDPNSEEAEDCLKKALHAATSERSPWLILHIIHYAQSRKKHHIAKAGYHTLQQISAYRNIAQSGLLQIASSEGNTEQMCRALENLYQVEGNSLHLNELLYLNLLSGRKLETTALQTFEYSQLYPQDIHWVLNYALLRYRQGLTEEARQLLLQSKKEFTTNNQLSQLRQGKAMVLEQILSQSKPQHKNLQNNPPELLQAEINFLTDKS